MRPVLTGKLMAAPLLLRVMAVVIDALIIVTLTIIADLALFGEDVEQQQSLAVVMIIMALYHIGFLVAKSATPGKAAVGICVVDARGLALRPDTAILRYLVYFVGGSILGVGTLISLALVLFDRKRRTLHDRVAGTIVVRGRPKLEDSAETTRRG
jgi:uncharacterized RDD family membrane protein YckC